MELTSSLFPITSERNEKLQVNKDASVVFSLITQAFLGLGQIYNVPHRLSNSNCSFYTHFLVILRLVVSHINPLVLTTRFTSDFLE